MLSVYADGSSTGRSNRPGGWSYVVVRNGIVIHSDNGGDAKTTNNRMELMGAIEGLKWARDNKYHDEAVELVCDSQYALGLASGEFRPKKNVDLATEIRRLAISTKCFTRWVKGHDNNLFNEQCDKLAKSGKIAVTMPVAPTTAPTPEPLTPLQAALMVIADAVEAKGTQKVALPNGLTLVLNIEGRKQ